MCEVNNIDEIDFMHMDIEGAEFDALSSMGKIRPKLIFMEMLPDYFDNVRGEDEIQTLLASYNYVLVARLSQDQLYIHQPQIK
jgi:hypothetical protein